MMMHWYGMGWIGMLVQVVIIIGVIYLMVNLLKRDQNAGRYNKGDAENILRERFAKGEISQEEYERMRDVLRK